MTMKRDTKAKVQKAATSAERVLSQSPSERSRFGRFLPLAAGRKAAAGVVRGNRTHGRTREMVVADKVTARRAAGRTAKLI